MNEIKFIRGDTQVFSLNITDGDGLPYELQPTDKLVLTVKRSIYNTDTVLQKTIDASMLIKFEHEDTKSISFGEYVYDVQLTQGDIVTTVIPPTPFILEGEVNYDK